MHENLTTLESSTVTTLTNLMSSVNFTDKNIRLGAGGIDNRSVFTYSKWYDWNRTQKNNFKDCFQSSVIDTTLVGWFLKFPANTGFLDLMDNWVETPEAGTVLAYALKDNQKIVLDGTEVTVAKGAGIKFKLSVPHKIETSASGQDWACLMQLI